MCLTLFHYLTELTVDILFMLSLYVASDLKHGMLFVI